MIRKSIRSRINHTTKDFYLWFFIESILISVFQDKKLSKKPNSAPPITKKALFSFLNPNTTAILIQAIRVVFQSIMLSIPIVMHTDRMRATEATFTPLRKEENVAEFLILFMKGPDKATNIKEGRNMAKVDTKVPESPLI